jgi:hypothetical protein
MLNLALRRCTIKTVRRQGKPVSVFMAVIILLIVIPYQPVLAGMIGTETVLETARGQEARDRVVSFLGHDDVQTVLMAQGLIRWKPRHALTACLTPRSYVYPSRLNSFLLEAVWIG